jgi:hypothetical protein
MKAKRNLAVAVVFGLGLLLPTLAMDGISAVRRAPRPAPPPSAITPWAAPIAAVDEALAQGDVAGAMNAWLPAHGVALRDRRWEGLVEVGDARLRIERASGVERNGKEQARVVYLMALFRARDEHSVRGLLRVANAFAALGDRDVAERAVRIAATIEKRQQASEPASVPMF